MQMKAADADSSIVKGLSNFFSNSLSDVSKLISLKSWQKLLVHRQALLVKKISLLYFPFYYLCCRMAKKSELRHDYGFLFLHFRSILILIFPSVIIFLSLPSTLGVLNFNQILNVTLMQFIVNRYSLQLNTSQLSELSDLEKCCTRAFDTEGLEKAPGLNSSEMSCSVWKMAACFPLAEKCLPSLNALCLKAVVFHVR